jgi:hypothetical protein
VKVRELIGKLRAMPQDVPVLLDTGEGGLWNMFDIINTRDASVSGAVLISVPEHLDSSAGPAPGESGGGVDYTTEPERPEAPNAPAGWRESLHLFYLRMQAEIIANDEKGNWREADIDRLVDELNFHLARLRLAIRDAALPEDAVREYAADVATLSYFIQDVFFNTTHAYTPGRASRPLGQAGRPGTYDRCPNCQAHDSLVDRFGAWRCVRCGWRYVPFKGGSS